MKFRALLLVPLLAVVLLAGCQPSGPESGGDARLIEAMNRGVSLMGQYKYDEAVKAFEEALAANPALLDAKVNLGMALFNRARKEDMAPGLKLLDEVLAKDPAHLRALYARGIILQHLGNTEEAIPCFEKVVKARPEDGAAWYLLGLCKVRVNRPAEEDLLRAIRLRPNLYSAYYQLYQAALRAGDAEKGKKYAEIFKTLRESPLAESIELPQYNYMGELALVQPVPAQRVPPVARSRYQPGTARSLAQLPDDAAKALQRLGGLAVADVNGDGLLDLAFPAGAQGRLSLFLGNRGGGFTDTTAAAGFAGLTNVTGCSFGDIDNDEFPDLFVAGTGGGVLLKGNSNGVFKAESAGLSRAAVPAQSGVLLDADHDSDLDLFVCSTSALQGKPACQLWNNNGDGTFTNIAAGTALECAGSRAVLVLPGDLDGDRDMDLVVLREGEPAKVFLNGLLGRFEEKAIAGILARGDLGGALQDFNGDGALDLLVLGGDPAQLALFLGDGHAQFKASDAFAGVAQAAASWGQLQAVRVADLDLDGDLDVAVFGPEGHALLNDGTGRFVLQSRVWSLPAGKVWAAIEVLDFNGDGVPDLLALERGQATQLTLSLGGLSPSSNALLVSPTGVRSRDNRTRSPASGYGTRLSVRAGLREQSLLHQGLFGGLSQSLVPVAFGLGGARKADYLTLLWPDGVGQVETALAAGQVHKIGEMQRKISSCPVLFAWNGERFEFVTDFAGVGGLGYFAAPGESAPPQVLEHVKIEPGLLRPRNGVYELRVTEPMEESAYVDRLELIAVDHPLGQPVFPDERLAISGPPPTHDLLVAEHPVFPLRATAPSGRDCTDRLLKVDRTYAYDPPLDRRYLGFCRPHTLELDFADRLSHLRPTDRVFLFINGFIEYPYSQTVYAAAQSRIGWEPIRVERLAEDGRWETLVRDAGAPGGMARTFTIDLTGMVGGANCRLRLTTNLEISYDQVFVSRDAGPGRVRVQSVPLLSAELRYLGFPREYSPDGRMPLIYDYQLTDTTAPFHVLRGAYTRYGSVKECLGEFDDRYVLVGPGDEIALRFDAAALPPPSPGTVRSHILVSHAYCKDMDLYTAAPQTLDPLPFRGMSKYPYPSGERFPDTPSLRAFRAEYHTRLVE